MAYKDKTKGQLVDELKALTERTIQLGEVKNTHLNSDEVAGLIKNALDYSLSGVIITNSKGLIIYANTTFLELFEYDSKARVIGKNSAELFDKNNGNPLDSFMAAADQKNIGTKEFMAQTRNGLLIPVEVAVSNAIDDKGKIVARMLSVIDITERKLLEEERIRRQIEEEREKASKLESLGRLAGGIAHDFNNLLTVIMGNISLAQTYVNKNCKLHQILADAEQASVRAKKLTKKFLTFSRGDQPVIETTSISELLKDSCQLGVWGSNVRSKFKIQDGLWPVRIDETQMHQVFSNIALNAAEAMADGGIMIVRAENLSVKEENSKECLRVNNNYFVRVTIKDQGQGISPKYQPKIFDPYFSTKMRGTQKGMGLGLSIVHSIMEKHNGAVKIESKKNAGTSCYLYIPAIPNHASDTEILKTNRAKRRNKVRLKPEKAIGDSNVRSS